MNHRFLQQLNEQQRAAVLYNEGPSLVIAGAGSGKTRVLTAKIAYLIEEGAQPWTILALTFTNKAAGEMKERIRALVGEAAGSLWMGTFHHVFGKILRLEGARLGYNSRFTIYDESDARSLVKRLVRELELDESAYKPAAVLSRISAAKNRLISARAYAEDKALLEADRAARLPQIARIYALYEARCRAANAMDFDDMLFNTYRLFESFPEVRQRYSDRFRHILVDEYQDTNYAQHCIIKQLTSEHTNLCVVGDDAQSIYSFRGANLDNILLFQRWYPNARLFKLEQNYRSTQTIVEAAGSLIAHNRRQIPKKVFSQNAAGERIGLLRAHSDIEEAEIVARRMERLHRQGLSFGGMAVLYRTNAQSRVFEETFSNHSLPFRLVGGLSFYQRKEIKDAMAYFRLAVNPNDDEALLRVINYPARGIGATTVGRLSALARERGSSLWSVLTEGVQARSALIAPRTWNKVDGFASIVSSAHSRLDTDDALTLAQDIMRLSGIQADVNRDNSPENISRRENLSELLGAIQSFAEREREETGASRVSLADYLAQAALMTDLTDDTDEEGTEKITLTTVHAAKGLEFDAVFVVGLEQDLFPSRMAAYSIKDMEEERRLFYVAITRAKRYCFLSYADSRFRYGSTTYAPPSPFLKEIDPRYLQREDRAAPAAAPLRTPSLSSLKPLSSTTGRPLQHAALGNGEEITVGTLVEHMRFGRGRVEHIEDAGDSAKATVLFENAGRKTLLLKFAKLKCLDSVGTP